MFNCYEFYTEQNSALDVEIQKLGKPHGPRPSNVLYSKLIMYLVHDRFTVTLIMHPWSTKIGEIDIFAGFKLQERNQKVEFRHRHGHSRQEYDPCDTDTPSMTMIH